jgi:hypothetical protein
LNEEALNFGTMLLKDKFSEEEELRAFLDECLEEEAHNARQYPIF